MKFLRINISVLLIIISVSFLSCKKFVETPFPTNELAKEEVFSSDATANAAQLAIFSQIAGLGLTESITTNLGMSADEFKDESNAPVMMELYTNSLTPANARVLSMWNLLFQYIYQANAVIDGLSQSSTLSVPVKQQLTGEAKFTRAFLYFYLTNIYGDVPYLTGIDYKSNSLVDRIPQDEIYQKIIADLKDAKDLLSENYVGSDAIQSTDERLRPPKAAVSALLARVYLFVGDWVDAESEASSVILDKAKYDTVSLNDVFLKNSREAIWQLNGSTIFNTREGYFYILPFPPYYVSLNPSVLAAFEANDKRLVNWIGSLAAGSQNYYYPYKYKVQYSNNVTEYTMILRLAEQYLIRAEAYAQQNRFTESKNDLNVIRSRAGLPNTTASDKQSLLQAIDHERQTELFCEFGHRWLDLKRSNRIDAIMSISTPSKGGVWNTVQQLYPIPQAERNLNPKLSQNSGY